MTVNVEYISSIGSPADQSLLARASLVGAGLLKNREARKTALALLFLASEAVFIELLVQPMEKPLQKPF
jgi:hypothetical protein